MKNINKIKEFWNKKALENETEMGNTLNDRNLRLLEIEAISKYLRSKMKVLDIGCGNGFSTISFAKNHDISIWGLDFSEAMIENANQLLKKEKPSINKKVHFFHGDILDKNSVKDNYDIIISERCLINLSTWDKQKETISFIHSKLKDNGLFIMLEGFIDNLKKINDIRKRFNLEPIITVWHNLFFEKAKFEKYITDYFDIKNIDNFGSTYMLITRTYLHAIQKDQKNFNQDLDYLATLLPDFGNFNYQQLYILKKK